MWLNEGAGGDKRAMLRIFSGKKQRLDSGFLAASCKTAAPAAKGRWL
jgi:hypothetical protein